jgi:hypothetical protein
MLLSAYVFLETPGSVLASVFGVSARLISIPGHVTTLRASLPGWLFVLDRGEELSWRREE